MATDDPRFCCPICTRTDQHTHGGEPFAVPPPAPCAPHPEVVDPGVAHLLRCEQEDETGRCTRVASIRSHGLNVCDECYDIHRGDGRLPCPRCPDLSPSPPSLLRTAEQERADVVAALNELIAQPEETIHRQLQRGTPLLHWPPSAAGVLVAFKQIVERGDHLQTPSKEQP